MADLMIAWNAALGQGDLVIAKGDLVLDSSLYPAIYVSLLTDRLANADDAIPDGSANRRGWVGDALAVPSPNSAIVPLIGSRLWLLSRQTNTTETLRNAEAYALEALQWLIDDGVVGSVTATASYPSFNMLQLQIGVIQQGASATYNVAWQMTAAAPVIP